MTTTIEQPSDVQDNSRFEQLLKQVAQCQICQSSLPLAPKPIIQLSTQAKLLIIGHAPGRQAHNMDKPFADKSGERLRSWLGLTEQQFYSEQVAILPMGFCYPGKTKNGDKAPDKRCYATWHQQLIAYLPHIQAMVLLGQHAQSAYLQRSINVTENAKGWQTHQQQMPAIWPLPHPSPRNNIWLSKNPWFSQELLPALQNHIRLLLPSAKFE
ncbi:hypothetical protein C2869_12050 [Saccharobesus litoralis]|uniref:Uracil-DNA glycosylase-like domain-containing protein n=1 Tax=Saccharobesus litoralis TaxID=2172099 RepID=A0A2S0VSN9_9ALTE|nr:uracil-DNA glycosylase family protein [Saccharobesus litoralis]AWB67120.1 hypothetical protein C2869_12050 [Saccharobesus litoralis]